MVQSSENLHEPRDHASMQQLPASIHPTQQVNKLFQECPTDAYSGSSFLRDYLMKFGSSLRSRSHLPLIIVVIVALIFIMQMSILSLLVRPQRNHMHSPMDCSNGVGGSSSEVITWLEKRVYTLNDDMNLVEARLESMRREYVLIKAQLEDFKHFSKHK